MFLLPVQLLRAGSGILFLGTGVSTGIPQLSHVLNFGGADHTFRSLTLPPPPLVPMPNFESLYESVASFSLETSTRELPSLTSSSSSTPNGATATATPAGTSSSCPSAPSISHMEGGHSCKTCLMAMMNPYSPNRRNNVSLVVFWGGKHILIDCGKTFRDSAIRWFPPYQISTLAAVILTHDHQDAMGGLDDLRDVQKFEKPIIGGEVSRKEGDKAPVGGGYEAFQPLSRIPVFLSPRTYASVENRFNYIVEASLQTGVLDRKVVTLQFNILQHATAKDDDKSTPPATAAAGNDNTETANRELLEEKKTPTADASDSSTTVQKERLQTQENTTTTTAAAAAGTTNPMNYHNVSTSQDDKQVPSNGESQVYTSSEGFSQFRISGLEGLEFTALPVWHGAGYSSLGFAFGDEDKVVYISDVSSIPENVHRYMRSLASIKVLVLDALFPTKKHYSHFNLLQGLEVVETIQPEMAYFVGMSCELEHYSTCQYLEKWLKEKRLGNPNFKTKSVYLAHDGLFVPLKL